ncbi:MAG: c-type cytochrome [Stellaceae bacterium]
MMHRLSLCAFAAAALASTLPARAQDDAAIKTKLEPCFACHGENGISELDGVPSIAGQPDLFLEWQLVFFRTGRVKSEIMEPVAAELSDEDIRGIGGYLVTLPPIKTPPPPDDAPAMTEVGAKLAAAQNCGNCHGDGFHGQQGAARIAGQREEVLVKALHAYKSGARFGTGVAAMPEIALQLNDDQMAALAHFLSRQR